MFELASQTHPYFERKSRLNLAKFGCNLSPFYKTDKILVSFEFFSCLYHELCVFLMNYVKFSVLDLTNRLHFSVCVYCNRSQVKSHSACKEQKSTTRDEVEWRDCCSLHAVTSSVTILQYTRKNVIYFFNTIKIQIGFVEGFWA